MRAGDIVDHKPSGERWVLAAVAGDRVYPAGWPPTVAALADCALVEACTDAEHASMVRRTLNMNGGHDDRAIVNRSHTCSSCPGEA